MYEHNFMSEYVDFCDMEKDAMCKNYAAGASLLGKPASDYNRKNKCPFDGNSKLYFNPLFKSSQGSDLSLLEIYKANGLD